MGKARLRKVLPLNVYEQSNSLSWESFLKKAKKLGSTRNEKALKRLLKSHPEHTHRYFDEFLLPDLEKALGGKLKRTETNDSFSTFQLERD